MASVWEEEAEVMRMIGTAERSLSNVRCAHYQPACAGKPDGELEALFRRELELADILLKPKPSGTAA